MPLTEALGEQLPPIKTSQDISELIAKVRPSVVTVIAYVEGDQPLDSGTGFFIAPDCLVTTRHLVEHASRGEIMLATGGVLRIPGLLTEDESFVPEDCGCSAQETPGGQMSNCLENAAP